MSSKTIAFSALVFTQFIIFESFLEILLVSRKDLTWLKKTKARKIRG